MTDGVDVPGVKPYRGPCQHCGGPVHAVRANARFCRDACRVAAWLQAKEKAIIHAYLSARARKAAATRARRRAEASAQQDLNFATEVKS